MIYPTKQRERARKFAMQALYSWQASHNNIIDIEKYYLADRNPSKFDVDYFKKLLHNIPTQITKLDEHIRKYSERELDVIGDIEHCILWVAIYELGECLDVPYKVIIFEALELAKVFGSDDKHKFINAILDQIARDLRSEEMLKTS